MVVVTIRVIDGDVIVELVESGQNFNKIRVTNNASVSALGKLWLDDQSFQRTFAPAEVWEQAIPQKKITDYIDGNMQAAYSCGPA
jgi:hypothetical protein